MLFKPYSSIKFESEGDYFWAFTVENDKDTTDEELNALTGQQVGIWDRERSEYRYFEIDHVRHEFYFKERQDPQAIKAGDPIVIIAKGRKGRLIEVKFHPRITRRLKAYTAKSVSLGTVLFFGTTMLVVIGFLFWWVYSYFD